MSLQFVIDGYNIINHPLFGRISNRKVRDRRRALVSLIKEQRLSGSLRNKVAVVFDGYPGPQGDSHLNEPDAAVSIIFSRKETADEKIKKIVESYPNPRNIVVVSDDKEVRFIVKSLNASVLSVEEFIGRPGKEGAGRSHDNEQEAKLTYSQMERVNQELRKLWLK